MTDLEDFDFEKKLLCIASLTMSRSLFDFFTNAVPRGLVVVCGVSDDARSVPSSPPVVAAAAAIAVVDSHVTLTFFEEAFDPIDPVVDPLDPTEEIFV
mmetsp:Transcript_24050/g.36557  ORF Transcript_24050/g.36557 Transcript_24050/m.36557 type:complete len:98 (-) Transcript_24050:30-323(-)